MSECESCGQEEIQVDTICDVLNEALEQSKRMEMDEMVYGIKCQCTKCHQRVDPSERIADITEKNRSVKEVVQNEQSNEFKFLEGQSLIHGME